MKSNYRKITRTVESTSKVLFIELHLGSN